MNADSLAVFEGKQIRRYYDESTETWYFSVVDIIQVLIQQPDYQAARNYWKVLKNRLNKEGSQSVTNCHRLKMVAEDGKMRLTYTAERGSSHGIGRKRSKQVFAAVIWAIRG
jgi:DNA-damage-inducible protein D